MNKAELFHDRLLLINPKSKIFSKRRQKKITNMKAEFWRRQLRFRSHTLNPKAFVDQILTKQLPGLSDVLLLLILQILEKFRKNVLLLLFFLEFFSKFIINVAWDGTFLSQKWKFFSVAQPWWPTSNSCFVFQYKLLTKLITEVCLSILSWKLVQKPHCCTTFPKFLPFFVLICPIFSPKFVLIY